MQNGNNMNKEPITLNGLNKLKEELIFLKEKKRPEIVAAIAEARSHGDLKENAEYHAAKEEQSHNEGRITEMPAVADLLHYGKSPGPTAGAVGLALQPAAAGRLCDR